ncbi:diguanylate cyclase, partial [Acidithiobacillus sp. IBUN Pt1247-S3]|uniref:diguanylate cyclase domain-containing protein n=1 Tax=Acidithiobacillus sp. IBUN Pt1247-S3 TaxID=3166642 RepID=UPI0034E540D9
MQRKEVKMEEFPEELRWLDDDLTFSECAQRDLRRLGRELWAHFPPITATIAQHFAPQCTDTAQQTPDSPYTAEWFGHLFSGRYDRPFWQEQLAIGARLAATNVPGQILAHVFTTLRTLLVAQNEDVIPAGIRPGAWASVLRVLDACQYVQHFGHERERRHAALRQLRGLLQEVDFEAFFAEAARLACGIAEADGAGLILREEGRLHYRLFHGLSARYQELGQWEFPETAGVSGAALARGEPVYVPDYPDSPWAMQEFVAAGLQASLAIPLPPLADEEIPGVLVISWFQQPASPRIPEDAWDHLRLLADLLGATLYRERLEHRMEGLATRDLLTDLPNRRVVQERLRAAMSRSDRHQRLSALFFLDLDGFKPVNDRLGHHRGDEVLCTIADQLCTVVRAEDCVIRYAGDEFLVILEDIANVEEVECIASRLLLAAQCSVTDAQTQLRVSASMGAVIYPFSDGGAEELIRQADLAMYAAKETGGNTWKLYGRDLIEAQQQEESLY